MLLNRYKQKGFGLEMLMLVGIMAAFALPAYQDYTKRARTAEGLMLGSSAKVAVAEYWAEHQEFPQGTPQEIHQKIGLAKPEDIRTKWVDQVAVEENGRIRISLNRQIYAGGSILLDPEPDLERGYFQWHCSVDPRNRALLKLVPAECR